MLTLERLEHELVKVKSQVGPEHVGQYKVLSGPNGRCLWGQMLFNLGCPVPERCEVLMVGTHHAMHTADYYRISLWMDFHRPHNWVYANDSQRLFVASITRANDAEVPWHEIIDSLVPVSQQAEVLARQFTEEVTPTPEVVAKIYTKMKHFTNSINFAPFVT